MPTPVATARQCLTEEAARALDDAVSVAKRRNHAQTTSLHAISALLSPSFSLLRDSLTRSRNSNFSHRLQIRALEFSIGVSLDRLPSSSSKNHMLNNNNQNNNNNNNSNNNDDFAPPISNSLMAAIKRSQANQRRQPDMYHLNQITTTLNNNNNNIVNNPISISSIKVELKHFVLSILDDPIVSRVFGEAGFRSSEIKLAIIHPPVSTRWGPTSSSSSSARCPPLFLCNFMDFNNNNNQGCGNVLGFNGVDENCKRIGEIMVKRREKKNPVLVGVCAKDALLGFKDCLVKGKFDGLEKEIHGLKMVCLEREFGEKDGIFNVDLKIKEVGLIVESCGENGFSGVVLNLGDLKVLVDEEEKNGGFLKNLVVKLSGLVEVYKEKLWLIGAVANYETYSSFVGRFPNVEKDWDLHPLPITSSSRSSFDGLGPKSSLMGSFVPFGGFFPTPSDLRPPLTAMKQPFTRCFSCNEKYEQELCAMLREGSSVSNADQYSASFPSWLQRTESDPSKGGDMVAQAKDVKTASNEKISGLQKKWDDHCWHLHQGLGFPAPGTSMARPQLPRNLGFQVVSEKQGSSNSSGDSSLNEGICSNSSSGMQIVARNIPPQQKFMGVNFPTKALEISESHSSSLRDSSATQAYPIRNLSVPPNQKPRPLSVTTDLGLGTIYASKCDELKRPLLQDRPVHLQHFPSSISANRSIISEKDSKHFDQSSFLAAPARGVDPGDYKPLFRKLSEAVAWQGEAISRISQIVSSCKGGNGRQRLANVRGSIWLSFLGPDKIGKRRVVEALADAMFGSRDRLITVDLSSQDRSSKANSIFHCQDLHAFDINVSRITVVDHIAQELCKKPHSIVFLENIDEADLLVQNSLSRAIQTGRFQDSRGREISINNVIFVASSSNAKDDQNLSPRKEFIKFAEEKILEAKNWQMQIAVRSLSGDATASTSNETRVSLVSTKCASDQGTSLKRKLSDLSEMSEHSETARSNKSPKTSLDLNLPLEETEEIIETDSNDCEFISDDSKAWLEGFFGQVDGNVVFKPFDFDALADKLMRRVRLKFEEISKGERMSLEIDYEVMVQMLAAAWSSGNKVAIEDWIEQILCASFAEAREKYRLTAASAVRLGSCEGVPVKEWASSICLPKSINLVI